MTESIIARDGEGAPLRPCLRCSIEGLPQRRLVEPLASRRLSDERKHLLLAGVKSRAKRLSASDHSRHVNETSSKRKCGRAPEPPIVGVDALSALRRRVRGRWHDLSVLL